MVWPTIYHGCQYIPSRRITFWWHRSRISPCDQGFETFFTFCQGFLQMKRGLQQLWSTMVPTVYKKQASPPLPPPSNSHHHSPVTDTLHSKFKWLYIWNWDVSWMHAANSSFTSIICKLLLKYWFFDKNNNRK